jgi:hypothetical protein
MVDRDWQLVEEPLKPVEIGGVEGGNTGAQLEAGLVQGVRVARRDDHLGSPLPREAGRLEPDAGAAADHDDGLAEQLPFVLRWRKGRQDHFAAISTGCLAAICPRSDLSAST